MKTTKLIIDVELDLEEKERDRLYNYCLDQIESSRKSWGTFDIMGIIKCEYYWYRNSRKKACLLITKSENFYKTENRKNYLFNRNLKLKW